MNPIEVGGSIDALSLSRADGGEFADDNDDAIGDEGLARLAADMQTDADDIAFLILAYKCQCTSMGSFSRAQFLRGCTELRVDTAQALKRRLAALREETLNSPLNYKSFYQFCFSLALADASAKVLPADVACSLWQLVLGSTRFPLLDDWTTFVLTVHKKAISRDVWNQVRPASVVGRQAVVSPSGSTRDARAQLLEFANAVPDLAKFDESAAWPSLIDQFVAAQRKAAAK